MHNKTVFRADGVLWKVKREVAFLVAFLLVRTSIKRELMANLVLVRASLKALNNFFSTVVNTGFSSNPNKASFHFCRQFRNQFQSILLGRKKRPWRVLSGERNRLSGIV